MKRIVNFITMACTLITGNLFARQDVEMADTMRSEGKIYVIVAIVLIVLAGLVIYLFTLDKKIKKLEDSMK